jgi:hypothetical protein
MKRTAAILTLVALVCLLGASEVRGAGALTPAGKTAGPALIATIVIDVTGGQFALDKGWTSIRVQKGSAIVAGFFWSSYVNSFTDECIASGFSLVSSTANRFTGLISGFVDNPAVLSALFGQFGVPEKAVITDQDYVACSTVNGRQILSFTAVINFER